MILSIKSGLSRIKVEPVYGIPVDPNAVFESLEDKRKNGTLSRHVTTAALRYQVSAKQPGYLDYIDQQGNITTSRFINGQFILLNEKTT